MALQIRRGTNKERLQITPAQGELIYVTDYELKTISVTAINTTTDVLTTVGDHGLLTGQQIRFQDTSKNGLVLNQVYYVKKVTDNTFNLSLTSNGANVDITGTLVSPATLVFATGPTNAAGAPLGINVTALWIGDGNTVGGVPGNTQGLDDLTDVTITTPAEGNTLYYDATTKQWKNTNILNIDDVTGTQNIIVNGTGTSQIRATNSNTNLGYTVLELVSKSSGTPANDFGTSLKFTANNIAGTEMPLGFINFNYDDITAGHEDAGISIGLMRDGVSPLTPPGTIYPQLKLTSEGNLSLVGDLYVGGGDITTAPGGIANLYNDNAVGTINIGNSVVTEVNIGNAVGSRVQIKSPTIVGMNTTQNVFNTVSTTVNAFGAATTLNLGASTGTTTINNNAVVTGNLTVNGTTTTVNSATLTVDDPNIVLNAIGAPTDANANGGGITLNGSSTKNITWDNTTKRWWFNNGTGGVAENNYPMVVDLTDIRNVETTAFNKGQMFYYDGTNWINGSNIKFNNNTYRPKITTQYNLTLSGQSASGSINSALNLLKDTTSSAYTDGAGTGLIMSVVSDSQPNQVDIGRLHAQYDSNGAHDILLATPTIDNNTYAELYRSSKDRTTFNNGKVYIDAVNGRLGINNTAPNTTLDVGGNIYASSTIQSASNITAGDNIFGAVDLYLAGNKVVLRNGATTSPVGAEQGFLVDRGATTTKWMWNESAQYWLTDDSIYANQSVIAGTTLATNGLNIYFNNDDNTPASTDNANLIVKRGSGADVSLRWNETTDRWQTTKDGSTYLNLPNQNLDTTDTPTFAGVNAGNISIGTANDNYIRSETGQLVIQSVTGAVSVDDDLIISGTTTSTGQVSVGGKTYLYANTGDIRVGNDVYVGGNFVKLNEKQTGTPTLDGLFSVERGDLTDAYLKWNEVTDWWNTSHSLLVGGDLTVQGNGYIYSSSNLALVLNGADVSVAGDLYTGDDIFANGNMLKLNHNQAGSPTLSAGIEIGRGSSANTSITWNESTDRWMFTNDGTNYTNLPVATDTPTYQGINIDNNLSSTPTGIKGTMAGNDYWFIGGYSISGNTSNDGALVIATSNNGDEPIYVRQYSNTTGGGIWTDAVLQRQLTLLDGSGNTTLPGQLNVSTINSTSGALQLTTTTSNNHIKLTPNGSGNVLLESSTVGIGDTSGSLGAQLTTNGAGDLRLDTNNSNTSGYINIATGTNGAITLSPHGTGSTNITSSLAVTGNLTITGNTIKKSGGTDVITFSGTNLTTFAGDIKLMGDSVYSSTGWRMFDYRETASIYGTSYQVKMNADKNIGVGVSYVYIDNMVEINTSSITTTQNSTYSVLDYFDPTVYRSAKYIVQITNGTTHQMWEGMVIHDGTDIYLSAYGDLRTNGNLATMSVGFNATTGYPELRVTPVNATQTKFKATKTYIAV